MDAGFQPNRICNSRGRRSRHQHRSCLGPNGLEEKGLGGFFIYLSVSMGTILNADDSAVTINPGKSS